MLTRATIQAIDLVIRLCADCQAVSASRRGHVTLAQAIRDAMDEIRSSTRTETPSSRLLRALSDLRAADPRAYAELLAVMWVGRGDEKPDDFATVVREQIASPECASYIAAKEPMLAEYLRTGRSIMTSAFLEQEAETK